MDEQPRSPRVVEVGLSDSLSVTESVSWTRDRVRNEVAKLWLVPLAILVFGPPVILELAGDTVPKVVAAAIGIALNLLAAWVGYRAITKRRETHHG